MPPATRSSARSARSARAIRPFTINVEKTLCFATVNGLLGFEIGDLTTGKMIHRVEVQGFKTGPVLRHGCPSHGIGLTPDEREIWVCDSFNRRLHIFDATVMPPRQLTSIELRDEPGWVTFTIDGRFAYPSSGEVIDTRTKKIITALEDEKGRKVESEKLLEIDFQGDNVVRNGDQFGVGRGRRSDTGMDDFKIFTSKGDRFTVEFPGVPTPKDEEAETWAGKINVHSFTVRVGDGTEYIAGSFEIPKPWSKKPMSDFKIDAMLDGAPEGFGEATKTRPAKKLKITLDKWPGRECEFESTGEANEHFRWRCYLAKNRVYQICVGWKNGNEPPKEIVDKFLNSLKILPE